MTIEIVVCFALCVCMLITLRPRHQSQFGLKVYNILFVSTVAPSRLNESNANNTLCVALKGFISYFVFRN